MVISEDIRSLIATGPLAHLTTLNADGSPQVSVVWGGIDRDESVSGKGKNPMGFEEYLVVYGEARITEGGAVPLLENLVGMNLTQILQLVGTLDDARVAYGYGAQRRAP